jgi:multicomponent Na+:H+ antiporter subunit F
MEITTIFSITVLALVLFIVVSLIRVIFGPTSADRVVGLDTINTLVVAVLIVLSALFKTVVYVDVAIVYALLSFIATLYIANYIGESSPINISVKTNSKSNTKSKVTLDNIDKKVKKGVKK